MKDKLVNLFVDESGIADLTDFRYKYFVLTSVAIHESETTTVEGYFSLIKRKYELDILKPFHTYDLIENVNSNYKLNKKDSNKFLNSMLEFITIVPMKIYVLKIDKEEFRNNFEIKLEGLKGSKFNKEKRGILYYLAALNQFKTFVEKL